MSATSSTTGSVHATLRREVGLWGAVWMGLGSIVGTGVFVSIGIAAGLAGPAVVLAIGLAAFVALCNALSSAQLAASHPVSGGTYEYGYRYLRPWLGFTAGWTFLLAKSASAATAALGFAGYLLNALQVDRDGYQVAVALGIVAVLTLIALAGVRRSSQVNVAIVAVSIGSLALFVVAGMGSGLAGIERWTPLFGGSAADFANATALMFVAYTGYGRIATLGEEVHEPQRTIPRAIVVTLVISAIVYGLVAGTGVASAGAEALSAATTGDAAPLAVVARGFDWPIVAPLVAIGAMVAMLGVILNLLLGLSRVVLAMGRRGDLPGVTARLNRSGTTPPVAVLLVGVAIAGLTALGSVRTTWSFSAFTVLVYYGITNTAALQVPREGRLYSRAYSWIGLGSCLLLAFCVDRPVWIAGLGLIAGGLAWHAAARVISRHR